MRPHHDDGSQAPGPHPDRVTTSIVVYEDESVDLFFGPEPPDDGASNWIRTLPGEGWFTVLRPYGPLEGYMDTSWTPSEIEPA
jgi:hypothetical protein